MQQNPYENKNINDVSGRGKPNAIFKMKKGYCQHMIDQNGIYNKKHLQYHVRDGKKYI